MKWLRSSLFKDNSDKFVFEEKIDIKIDNFDSALKGINDVIVRGTLTRNGQDKIIVNLKINGFYKVLSSRSLNVLEVPFEINEREEFIDKTILYGENDYDTNTMDMFIDITDLVNELIIINVPTSYYLEDELVDKPSGEGWELVSDEDYIEEERKDNPFSALSDMFKEK
ncbi:hypothetical protein HZY83_05785 [Gemella sp. GH3]|uniref:YceD family protein n=1 Tax=unclassified Gemella TaxID=2624949 RepID=UPI0015CFC82E|nr:MULTISPECIES: YceD family protein [unclassified Gemella]MBF0714181.1 hypothetical protein [Gemella sp. GH3.1]NYS51133.1 hypothetical protein [Gemella sp. GH3]